MPLAPPSTLVATYEADRRALRGQLSARSAGHPIAIGRCLPSKISGRHLCQLSPGGSSRANRNAVQRHSLLLRRLSDQPFAPEQVAFLFSLYLDFRFYEQIGALIGHVETSSPTSPELERQIANYYQGIGNWRRPLCISKMRKNCSFRLPTKAVFAGISIKFCARPTAWKKRRRYSPHSQLTLAQGRVCFSSGRNWKRGKKQRSRAGN